MTWKRAPALIKNRKTKILSRHDTLSGYDFYFQISDNFN